VPIVWGCFEHTVSCPARHEFGRWFLEHDSALTRPQLPNHVPVCGHSADATPIASGLRLLQRHPNQCCRLRYDAV
jgi:hypothetical protein